MKIALFTKKNKPTVKKVIEYLRTHSDDFALYEGIRGDTFPQETDSFSPDILISYISPWIIPKEVLDKTRLSNINFHPGPPDYPGIGCFNFAIYNNERNYGVTAHLMEEKVDRGRIIGIKKFHLSESDSVYSLSVKSYEHMLSLFYEVMDFVIKNKAFPICNETWKVKPYTRKELEDLCKIQPTMQKEEIERRIKATTYPHMPCAYVELFNHRFEYNPNR